VGDGGSEAKGGGGGSDALFLTAGSGTAGGGTAGGGGSEGFDLTKRGLSTIL
jgi:hypothetical protein